MSNSAETPFFEAPTSVSSPVFVDAAKRTETVPLDWPVEYDGKVWLSITVRRLNTAEIRAFYERLAEAEKRGENVDNIRIPVFDAPDVVLDALDADDDEKLAKVANDFLPRRFRAAIPTSAPAPVPGASSQPA